MKNNTILVIDSKLDHRLNLELILSAEDFDVITAPSAETGIHCAIHERPDLILVDANVPQVGGYALCETLFTRADTKNIPVYILSQETGRKAVEKAQSKGAIGLITAPPYTPHIIRSIRQLGLGSGSIIDSGAIGQTAELAS